MHGSSLSLLTVSFTVTWLLMVVLLGAVAIGIQIQLKFPQLIAHMAKNAVRYSMLLTIGSLSVLMLKPWNYVVWLGIWHSGMEGNMGKWLLTIR